MTMSQWYQENMECPGMGVVLFGGEVEGTAEDVRGVAQDGSLDLRHVHGMAEEALHRGDAAPVEAAGDDAGEVPEAGVHVQRETVPRHAVRDVDAQGAELAVPDPDAAVAVVAVRGYAEVGRRPDDRLLDAGDVVEHAEAAAGEVEDRIAHELAGAVVGDVPAAVGLGEPDAGGGAPRFVPQHVFGVGGASEGVDGGVLEEKEGVGARARVAGGGDFRLEGEGLLVGDPRAKVAHPDGEGGDSVLFVHGGYSTRPHRGDVKGQYTR